MVFNKPLSSDGHHRSRLSDATSSIRIVGVESILGPLGTSATEWPIVPAPGDCGDGEFGGMKMDRGNRSTRRKPAPVPLCPPQIPLDQTLVRAGSTPGRRGGKPATNRLSYGAALTSQDIPIN
jgi:hypothetical protein